MRSFAYHRPKSVSEASSLSTATDARVLAGGMTLIPTLKLRLAAPSALVDLSGITELRGIKVAGGTVTIGAMTRHAEIERSAEIRGVIPALADLAGGIGDPQVRNRGTLGGSIAKALADLAGGIGDPQVRNRGTLGGSIANNDPAADFPAAVLGLGATVTTNKRSIAGDAFFTGMFETALRAGEIITSVSFPVPLSAAYEKFRSPASRYALVGVFVAKSGSGVRVAVTGAAPCVFRAKTIEAVLSERFTPDAVASLRFPADGLTSDLHGDAEFRAHLIGVLTKRAVDKALAVGGKR
jgi:carbon-monoxide dehydrogenase medium subunit